MLTTPSSAGVVMLELNAAPDADPWAVHEAPELDFGLGVGNDLAAPEEAAPEAAPESSELEQQAQEPDPAIPWDVVRDAPEQAPTVCRSEDVSGKVLVVLTNTRQAGDVDTGYDAVQRLQIEQTLTDLGFSILWSSPDGGCVVADPATLETAKKHKYWPAVSENDYLHPFETVALKDVDPSYCLLDAVIFVGGRGALYDFVSHDEVRRVTRETWEQNKVVAAVGRGVVAVAGVILENGTCLVEGREVTGTSNDEEDAMGQAATLPVTVEEALEDAGAGYKKGLDFQPNIAVAERLITGQNTASATIVAQAVVGLARNPHDVNVWAQFVAVGA